MNFFENELRKLFYGDVVFDDTTFVGRVCFGDVGEDLRAKVEFIAPEKWNRYSGLRVAIMNRTTGIVDFIEIAFRDVMNPVCVDQAGPLDSGRKEFPYIWVFDGKVRWLPADPGPEDYKSLRRAVGDYAHIFRSREERTERASLDEKIQDAEFCGGQSGLPNHCKENSLELVR